MMKRPDVSVLVPTYRRPDLLTRCLNSIVMSIPDGQDHFEVVIGDDSVDGEINRTVLADFASRWRGSYTYLLHSPNLGQQQNFNELLRCAQGRFIQFLHDDDYFLNGAGQAFLAAANRPNAMEIPIKFGVWLVTQDGRHTRTESPASERQLSPRQGVRLMISESSYVRFPAMFVPRSIYETIGFFDLSRGYVADLALWLKMTKAYGLLELPTCTTAYTIHEAAGTSTMFTPYFIANIRCLLDEYADFATDDKREGSRLLGKFMWRFVLAGQFRALRTKNWAALQQRVDLASCPEMQQLPCPPRWLGLRAGFRLAQRLSALVSKMVS
jgi:glycosyltransferase involved in cell wall biosynthesis